MNSTERKRIHVRTYIVIIIFFIVSESLGLASLISDSTDKLTFDSLVYKAPIIVLGRLETLTKFRVSECYRGGLESNKLVTIESRELSELSARVKQSASKNENSHHLRLHDHPINVRFRENGLVGTDLVLFMNKSDSRYGILSYNSNTVDDRESPQNGILLVMNGRVHLPSSLDKPEFLSLSELSRRVKDRKALTLKLMWHAKFSALGFSIENVSDSAISLNLEENGSVILRELDGNFEIEVSLSQHGWTLFGNCNGELGAAERCSGNYVFSRNEQFERLKGKSVEAIFSVSPNSKVEPIEQRIIFNIGH